LTPEYEAAIARFPKLTEADRRRLLDLPSGPVRLIIDTDTNNEIDDQFAVAWALMSQDILEIEGIFAAPFSFAMYQQPLLRAHDARLASRTTGAADNPTSAFEDWLDGLEAAGTDPHDIPFPGPAEGMESSYKEILTVFEKMGIDPAGQVYRGSDRFLASPNEPVHSPAVDHLIKRALEPSDRPLYVAAIGAITNVASALLIEPEIIHNMVVVWTASFPSNVNLQTQSLNLEQDMLASQILFDCGVPLVYLPGHHVGAQLRISLPEMETWVKGQGAIGDYLHWLFTHNPIHYQRGIVGHFARTWIMWDLINFGWLLNPKWVPSALVPTPSLSDDKYWQHDQPGRPFMREAHGVNRDAIFRDFLAKLEKHAQNMNT
jgi:hypothetical protein